MSVEISSLISKDVDIKDGKAVLAGTNTPVYRIAIWYKQGMTAEEIIEDCPHSPEIVYAALTYYHANKEEIEAEIKAENDTYESLLNERRLKQM